MPPHFLHKQQSLSLSIALLLSAPLAFSVLPAKADDSDNADTKNTHKTILFLN